MKKALLLTFILLSVAAVVWAADDPAEQSEWQPQYGEKGELLNAEPAVAPFGVGTSGDQPGEPPRIQTILLDENFSNWGPYGDNPPTGWSILDSAAVPAPAWNNYDWYRYASTTWGVALARVQGTTSERNDDWIVSPIVDFSAATLCSLTYRYYYDDFTTTADSLIVYLSDDGGVTWGYSLVKYTGADSGSLTSPKTKGFDISTEVAGKSQIVVAFRYSVATGSGGTAGVDNVRFVADGTELLNETMDGSWGPQGDVPPAGWTITDNYIPDPWNNNDWAKYYYTTWTDTIARVYYSPTEPMQREWLITPAINCSPAVDQILLTMKQWYDDGSSTTDSAFVLGSIDGGATWPYLLALYFGADEGSSSAPSRPVLDVTSWANGQSNVKFAFKYVGDGQIGGWYMDSVKVETIDLPSNEVATTAINSPTLGITGYDWPVNTQVFNNGDNTVTFTDYTDIFRINRSFFLNENFETPVGWNGGNPPTGWAVVDSGSLNDGWNNNDWGSTTAWGSQVAWVNYSPVEQQLEWFYSPAIDCSGGTNIFLSFSTYYNDITTTGTDTAWVLGSTDNWATSQLIALWNEDHGTLSIPEKPVFDISSWAAGQSNVKIAFRYVGNNDWYWYIDDVQVYTPQVPTLVYTSSEAVTNLASLESRAVPYAATWNDPDAGDYAITSYTALVGDVDPSNDTLSSLLTVYEHYESGGPDGGYYSWATNKDGGSGDPFNWIDITTIGTPVTWDAGSGDDRYTYGIPLGFTFPFYGNNYTRIFVNENGLATFDSLTTTELTNYGIPSTSGAENILALLWDNLNGVALGSAYYYSNNVDTFIVSYINWDWDSDPGNTLTVQFIITAAGGIKYQYQSVGPLITLSHTIGIENAAGDIGLQFVYNGSPMGNIAMPGLAITFVYNPPSLDVATVEVVTPIPGWYYQIGDLLTPQSIVSNLGTTTVSFTAYFEVHDATGAVVYSNSQAVNNLGPLAADTVDFADFTPTMIERDTSVAYVIMAGDTNLGNDTTKAYFNGDTHQGEGGPDDEFYVWIDNTVVDPEAPVFSWVDITGDGTQIAWANKDDDTTGFINMGFPSGFTYYGRTVNDIKIGCNGHMTFTGFSSTGITNYNLPSASAPREVFSPTWDDLYGYLPTSQTYYKYDAVNNRFIVSWIDWSSYTDSAHTFNMQAILDADENSIVFQYDALNRVAQYDFTVGIQDSTRTVGLSYYYGSSTTIPGTPKLNVPYGGLAIKFYQHLPAHDILATAFLAPGIGGVVGQPITPEVEFFNQGYLGETSVPVRLLINPGGYNDVQSIPSIDPGATATVTFSPFTPLTGGAYELTAIPELVGDEYPQNDTVRMTFTAYDDYLDFEADNGGFAATNDWEWGTPTGEGPGGAHSGVNCWGTVLAGVPPAVFTISNLDFVISITGATPSITFWEWSDISSVSGYNRVFIDSGAGYVQYSQRQTSFSWQTYTVDLTGYTGLVKIRLQNEHGTTVSGYPGWYVDDFGYLDCHMAYGEIGVTPTSVSGAADPGGTDSEVLTITNTGVDPLLYSVRTIQNVGLRAGSIVEPEPLGYRQLSDKGLTSGNGTEPYYPPVVLGAGGPDAFGYTWIDSDEPGGPTFGWVDITGSGVEITPWPHGTVDDGYTDPIAMGMTFNFYGIDYSSIVVSTNGWVSFLTQTSAYLTNASIPNTAAPNGIIGVEWEDLDGGTVGHCYYFHDAANSRFIVSWVGWPYFPDPADPHDIQVILDGATGNITAQYRNNAGVWQAESTEGIENESGTVGLQVAYNSAYLHNDMAILYEPPVFWLSVDNEGGELAPSGNAIVNVLMSAIELPTGIYSGAVEIKANDIDEPVTNIPVTFIVGGLGTIAGTVTDVNTGLPLADAIVGATLVGAVTIYDTTDANGNYSMTVSPGEEFVSASKAPYTDSSIMVTVIRDQTTTVNLGLRAGRLQIDTTPIVQDVSVGDTAVISRVLSNNGTDALGYRISLATPDARLLFNFGTPPINDIPLDSRTEDRAPNVNPDPPVITAFSDLLFSYDVETPVADPALLGVEFDGEFFWVTGRHQSDQLHKLYKYDRDGNHLATYEQGTWSLWGLRDLAFDGTLIWGGDDNVVYGIDRTTGTVIDSVYPAPTRPAVIRGLAYDPVAEEFWTADFASQIFKFDRSGALLDSFPNTLNIYGLAWDNTTPGGPFLWTFSQDGALSCQVSQFDPATGTYTGVVFDAAFPEGTTASIAGGMCFTSAWDPIYGGILIVLGQGTPKDYVAGYEVTTTWLSIIENGSGVLDAGQNATVSFMVDFRGPDIVTDTTYEAEATFANGSPYGAPVLPFQISSPAGGCAYIPGDVNGVPPANGIDVTYGVAYFKGGNVPPIDCGTPVGPCPQASPFYAALDVNGSCTTNGIDITYFVAYLKGGSPLRWCPTCPPAGTGVIPTIMPKLDAKSINIGNAGQ